jgi:hypothetical protein
VIEPAIGLSNGDTATAGQLDGQRVASSSITSAAWRWVRVSGLSMRRSASASPGRAEQIERGGDGLTAGGALLVREHLEHAVGHWSCSWVRSPSVFVRLLQARMLSVAVAAARSM